MSSEDAMNQIIEMELETEKDLIRSDYNYLKSDYDLEDNMEFNVLFERMLKMYPSKVFKLVNVISEEQGVPEDKLFRSFSDENRSKLKNYAMNNYNTKYYETKEREKVNTKMRNKGRLSEIRDNIEDLFE
jgi:hypothetical protein